MIDYLEVAGFAETVEALAVQETVVEAVAASIAVVVVAVVVSEIDEAA